MKQGHLTKFEIGIWAGVLVLGTVFWFVASCCLKSGDIVQVRVDGSISAEYPLDRDATYTIEGVNGGTNLLVVEDGCAFIREASCPDGLCISQGRIKKNGQSIICLPNRVVVEVIKKVED